MKKRLMYLLMVGSVALSCSGDDDSDVPDKIEETTKIYFSEHSGRNIGVVDPAKVGEHVILANHFDDGLNNPTGIAIDQEQGMLYAAETDGNRIIKLKADGTGDIVVLYDEGDGVAKPQGLAIDPGTNKIYWANEETHQILQGDMNGSSNITPLYGGAEVFEYDCFSLSIGGGLLYFPDSSWGRIYAGKLDGSSMPELIIPTDEDYFCTAGIQVVGDKLYWADYCANKIFVANADGSSERQILFDETDDLNGPYSIGVDKVGGKIYWSEFFSTVIAGGNLDGSGNRQILEEKIFSLGIVVSSKD
jgi:DNA-binding beta-propeller fold protein YncE